MKLELESKFDIGDEIKVIPDGLKFATGSIGKIIGITISIDKENPREKIIGYAIEGIGWAEEKYIELATKTENPSNSFCSYFEKDKPCTKEEYEKAKNKNFIQEALSSDNNPKTKGLVPESLDDSFYFDPEELENKE